jgi:hypothetical protein
MTKSLKDLEKRIGDIPKEAYDYFVSITPKDKGNARRSTQLKGNTIHANYPYAQKLDEGYSKQAPKGMTEPTGKFIERITRQKMRK